MGDHAAETPRWVKALERAWRTFYVAIGADAAIMIGTGLTSLLTEHDVTSGQFWSLLGVLAVKSLLAASAAFLLRLKRDPKTEK